MAANPVPLPSQALFNSDQQVFWSDGNPFDGFGLIELVLPKSDSSTWAYVSLGNAFPGLQLPLFQIIPIVYGSFNGSCGIYLNSAITPPGSYYRMYYYDATMRQISGPGSNFQVTSTSAFTPTIPTLTIPTGVTNSPTDPD